MRIAYFSPAILASLDAPVNFRRIRRIAARYEAVSRSSFCSSNA